MPGVRQSPTRPPGSGGVILWIDVQLPPSLAEWISQEFEAERVSLSSVGLRDAGDFEVFTAAGDANATVMTKDSDFLNLLDHTVHHIK